MPAHPTRPPQVHVKKRQARNEDVSTRASASAQPLFQATFQAFQAEPQAASAAPSPVTPGAVVQAVDAKTVDEHFLKDLLSAEIADISFQLDIQLQGRTAVDHIPQGLSTVSQYLLYREQLLENPYPAQWVMAPWQALRTNAGRASLIRKYQRPFSSLKDPERDRCARYLLSLFTEPVPLNSIGRTEFFGFIDCILQSRLNYERHITEGATFFQELEENVVGYKFRCEGFPGPPLAAQNWHMWAHATTREGATGILASWPPAVRPCQRKECICQL